MYAPPQLDAELLLRFAAERDGVELAALVRRNGPAVLGLWRRWLGEFNADDAFQAKFVTLARKSQSSQSEIHLIGKNSANGVSRG
jgi:hypothetical protein